MNDPAALEWRPIAPSDARRWSQLLAACEAADGGWVYFTEDVLISDFADPDTDFDRGSVAVYDGPSLAAYGLLTSCSDPTEEHEMRFDGAVHPAYRRQGIGSQLLDWAETAAVGVHHDRFPALVLSLSTTCTSTNENAAALYAAHGYQPTRWFHAMVQDLGEPPPETAIPAGVQIAGFTPDRTEDARIIRNEAFHDHWGSTEQTVQSWAHFIDFDGFRPEQSFLAYDGGEPLGLLISHEYDQPAGAQSGRDLYVAVVATRRAARGRGIASALLGRALADAAAAGYATASLEVDANSLTRAVGLYERAGFTLHHATVRHAKVLTGLADSRR